MYSFSRIDNVADCDILLSRAAKEKSDLTLKKMVDEHTVSNYGDTSVEIGAVLQGVIAELAATQIMIDNLPEGPTKEDAIKRRKRLEYRQFTLENRKESYGAVALLEKQLDLTRINSELEEVEAFIAGVTAHKETL